MTSETPKRFRASAIALALAASLTTSLATSLIAAPRASADSAAAPIDLHDALARADAAAADLNEMPRWTPEAGDTIAFKVLRKGNPFGQHTVSFDAGEDGTLIATTSVDLKAGLGPITVYRYSLRSQETWRDGTLVRLEGDLDTSDQDGQVSAAADGDGFVVNGTEFSGTVPLGILPSSHWNILQMQASQIVSTEDGEIIDIAVTQQGRETIEVDGQTIEAMRYLMDSDIDVDLWYDNQGRWVKLAFEVRGQDIEYVLDQSYG